MDDFEIEIFEENNEKIESVQLPLNFLTIGEVANDDVKVYIKQKVYKELEKYAASDTNHELGTILVGNYCEELGKLHVIVSDFIYAKYTDASASTLTFTHETWEYVNKCHDTEFPDKLIVGWQHTHPSYGIFLSNYDMFIQENFFNLPFQIAYVIDPVQHLRGFFQWKSGKVEKLHGFYIYDDIGEKIKIENENKGKSVNSTSKTEKTSYLAPVIGGIGILAFIIYALIIRNTIGSFEKRIADLEDTIAQQNENVRTYEALLESMSQDNDNSKEEIEPVQSDTEVEDDSIKEETVVEPIEDKESEIAQTDDADDIVEEIKFVPYKVEKGDTLVSICDRNGIDYLEYKKIIMSVNGIEDSNYIYTGELLLLPSR